MIPTLYTKTETDFTHNGIGFLVDAIKCTVSEERNGSYELVLQYPITGRWYDEITEGAIVKAKVNETSNLQLFRIYKSSKPLKGIVTYSAEHISYDLNGIPSLGLAVKNVTPQMAMTQAFTNAVLPCPFTALSDISTLNSTSILTPCGLRSILGGQSGSVLDVWGGEYEFDNFVVKLHAHRGKNNGVTIEYGKNLKDLNQESNITDCYTHLCPYAVQKTQDENGDPQENYLYLTEKVIALPAAAAIGHSKAYIIDFSDYFGEDEEVTEEKLRVKATEYAAVSNLGVPKVNITVSFIQLWQTEEYKNIAPLERVKMCDTVTVRFSKLGVMATAKVIKTSYNSLEEKYESVTLGDAKSSFADTVNKQQDEINDLTQSVVKGQAKATEELKRAIAAATSLITGHSGGYVVFNPAEKPQEILILDAPTIEEAVNVWRWNGGGLGHSSTGYNGEFSTAITADGSIVADFVNAGTLNGGIIKADTIKADAISGDTLRIIFNTISDYIYFENGQLKVVDKSDNERVILGKNGLEIFDGGITIYKGSDSTSPKAMYLDANGDISYAGYISQPNSPVKARVGRNTAGQQGFFVYSCSETYKNNDGSYEPFIEFAEVQSSNTRENLIMSANNLKFYIGDKDNGGLKKLVLECNKTGGKLYGDWYGTSSQAIPSDKRLKHSIEDLSAQYANLFDLLKPKRYKYNDSKSERYHIGFIAQDVEQALDKIKMPHKDFAGFVKDGEGNYFLRYEEFIALCVNEIQNLKKDNIILKNKIDTIIKKLGG